MMAVRIHECVKKALLLGITVTLLLWLASSPFVSANDEEEALLPHTSTALSSSTGSEYHHVWPEMGFGWRIVGASVIGFLGAAFGSVGGVGGGGIFVPMLTLIIGFDPKSATAISKCMITGAAVATVVYNLKLRHPTLDLPIVEYDLILLIQPVLLLGISIGVTFNVIFPDWMVTILLITLLLATAIRAFFKGLEIWKKESSLQEATAAKYLNPTGDLEYKPLLEAGNANLPRQVTVIENIRWKELGLVTFVWLAYLALQISKIPVSGSVFLYQAIGLYKGTKKIGSKGEEGMKSLKVKQLALFSISGLFAGIVGGMLGLGGGFVMGPLFLELGIPPQVTSATATLGMAFSASMSVAEYYLLHRFPVPYALYLVGVSIVAAYIGQYLISVVVGWSGRASLIIFVLSFTIFVSAISLGGIGITNLVEKIEKGEYMGFENLCQY